MKTIRLLFCSTLLLFAQAVTFANPPARNELVASPPGKSEVQAVAVQTDNGAKQVLQFVAAMTDKHLPCCINTVRLQPAIEQGKIQAVPVNPHLVAIEDDHPLGQRRLINLPTAKNESAYCNLPRKPRIQVDPEIDPGR